MASVRVDVGLSGEEDASTVPREEWSTLMTTRSLRCKLGLAADCRVLLHYVQDGAKNNWLGYASREAYIAEGLGIDPSTVEWALEGLKKVGGEAPVGLDEAVVLGRHGAFIGNQNARKHGATAPAPPPANPDGQLLLQERPPENQKGGKKNEVYNVNSVSKGGNRSTYTLARLRRDAPELAQEVEVGKMTPHTAAIKAGFRRRTFTIPADPERAAVIIAKKFPGWKMVRDE